MSYKLVSMLLREYTGPRHALPVLLVLADYANQGGIAWPSRATIAARCKISDRQVRHHLSTLADTGWLRLIGSRAGGRAKSAHWQIVANREADFLLTNTETGKPASSFSGLKGEVQRPKGGSAASERGKPTSPEAVRTYKEPVCASFEGFWRAYPKRRGKQDALKAWAKLKPDEATALRIVQHVEAAVRTHEWRKADGQFVPLPATYLNGRRFDDELVVTTTADKFMVAL